jgi:hypothetical protein
MSVVSQLTNRLPVDQLRNRINAVAGTLVSWGALVMIALMLSRLWQYDGASRASMMAAFGWTLVLVALSIKSHRYHLDA